MSKADILELAEQILQKRTKSEDSPRYVVGRPKLNVDPCPKIGPLSADYKPPEDDASQPGLYQEIPDITKQDPLYEGLYLKPSDGNYIDSNAIENKPSPAPSKKSEYEVEDAYS